MEAISNLAWLLVSLCLMGATLATLRSGKLRVSAGAALTTTALLCILLLPVISMTDDLLENRQAALPLAAQSWHLASEAASVGLEALPLVGAALLLLALAMQTVLTPHRSPRWSVRPYAAWLARSQRLRPPPDSHCR